MTQCCIDSCKQVFQSSRVFIIRASILLIVICCKYKEKKLMFPRSCKKK